jgi:hypothetical protein
MNKNSLIALFLVFLLFAAVNIGADNHEDVDIPANTLVYDHSNPASFDYVNGNYATITDWSTVQWASIPLTRIVDVPPKELDYGALNLLQRREMNPFQIAENFDHIDDLGADVSETSAILAIEQSFGVRFSGILQPGNNLQIRDGVMTSDIESTQGKYQHRMTLNDVAYKEGSVSMPQGGDLWFTLDKKAASTYTEFTIPKTDSLVVKFPEGNKRRVEGGIVEGKFKFNKGNLFVSKHEGGGFSDVKLHGLTIEGFRKPPQHGVSSSEDIPIFFDGRECTDCISFSEDKNSVRLQFTQQKASFNLGGFLWDATSSDSLEFSAFEGEITAYKRDQEDKIPHLIIKSGKDPVSIDIDHYGFGISEDGISLRNFHPGSNLAHPVRISGIGGSKTDELVTDAHGNFVILPSFADVGNFECLSCDYDFSKSPVYVNHVKARLQKYNINLQGKNADDFQTQTAILQMIEQMPPRYRAEFADKGYEIHVGSPPVLDLSAHAYALPPNIVYYQDDISFNLFAHETSHALTFKIFKEEHTTLLGEEDSWWVSEEEKTPFWTLSKDEKKRVLERREIARRQIEGNTFYQRWSSLSPESGENVERFGHGFAGLWWPGVWEADTGGSEDNHLSSGAPRFGCMGAYGCSHIIEDIATMADEIIDGTEEVLPILMEPESKFYRDLMGKEILPGSDQVMTPELAQVWAGRYRGKLDLLGEYGIISAEQHRDIVQKSEKVKVEGGS